MAGDNITTEHKEKVREWIENFSIEKVTDIGNVFNGVILGEYGAERITKLRNIEFFSLKLRV